MNNTIKVIFVALILYCGYFPTTCTCALDAQICSCPYARNIEFLLQEWRLSKRMIMLGNCTFWMGSNKIVAIPGDKETPVRLVKIDKPFWIDKTEVTKKDFSKFVESSKHITTAEKLGTSFVFTKREGKIDSFGSSVSGGSWWLEKKLVSWRTNHILSNELHPVNHVSWFDAIRFCQWRGGTLPSESEWEFACRGGLHMCLYPWGNKLKPNGSHMTNIWQGKFPTRNTIEDGFEETSPVGSFPPNQFGIHDMVGNVWEWILDFWSVHNLDVRVQKGGSFMCHRLHCFRYRCGARTKGTSDSTSSNLGFRCAQHVRVN